MAYPLIQIFLRSFKLIFILIFITPFFNNYAIGQSKNEDLLKKLVIDAGHGGKDPGTIGTHAKEKDIALSIALKLGKLIQTNLPEVEIIFTRKDDRFIPLDVRSQIANEAKADLFISIHCNANPSKNPFGTETYVMGLHKTEENLSVALRENSVISYEEDYSMKYEGYDPKSSESYIIFTLMQNAFLDQSLNLASFIQTEMRDRAQRKDRGVKQAGFLVLWKTSMPSVLVEVGYLSNQREELFLISDSGQDYIASAIFRAFREYKKNYDTQNAYTAQLEFDQSLNNNKVEEKSANISTKWSDEKKEGNANQSNDIVFRVQLTSSSKKIPINPTNFKGLQDIEEMLVNGTYKYVSGNKKTYQEIVEYAQVIRKSYPDAFIIAVKKGNIIPVDVALKELTPSNQ